MEHDTETTYLKSSDHSLKNTAKKIFERELSMVEDLPKKLPLIKWSACEDSKNAFYLYLLSFSGIIATEDFVSKWNESKDQQKILTSQSVIFHLPEIKRPLFFAEILIHIQDSKKELPELMESIKEGLMSSKKNKLSLEMEELSSERKNTLVYETAVNLVQKYPKWFTYDIFADIQNFLTHCREELRARSNVRLLCRIVCTQYFLQKKLVSDIRNVPKGRHLYLKLIRTHRASGQELKQTLGICIALNSLNDYESFELKHILSSLKKIVPEVKAIEESYYSCRVEEHAISFIYLEMTKTKGKNFTQEEIKDIKTKLPYELKINIEYFSPSLFIPRTEEQLIRNIIDLSHELRNIKDIPLAIISFQEQRYNVLKFHVILLRALTPKNASLLELSRQLPQKVQFIPERVANVGYIRNKTVKEANVFSLEVENQLFLRKNHSVDLVKARQYVVKLLEKMLGIFRDFNGTFLQKQNEELEEIKRELCLKEKATELLIDNLFSSFSHASFKTFIPKKEAKELSTLFLKSLESELDCHLELKQDENSVVFVLKTTLSDMTDKLSDALKSLQIEQTKLTCATVEVDRYFYICYLLFSPKPNLANAFVRQVRQTIQTWQEKKKNLKILRLHLPRAAQTLDPRIACDRTSGIVIKMLYEGLMRVNEKGEIEKAIAKDITVAEDGKKYIFNLKKTVWSNGSPLTAHDFEYAWKKQLEPDFLAPYSYLFFSIKNAEAVKRGEKAVKDTGVRALDDYTLAVELEHPAKYFLGLTSSWVFSPLCRAADQKHPGWAYHNRSTHICNGAFKLDIWKLNDDFQVVRNPFYWDAENVFLDRIQMAIVEDERKSLDLFLKGDIDWVGDPLSQIPISGLKELDKKIQTNDDCYGLFLLQLNTKKPPLQNAKIRKALSYAINRKKLIEKVQRGPNTAAFSFFHPPHLSNISFPDGDIEKAKKLFNEGLAELELKKEELPPIEITHSEIEIQAIVTHEIGETWKEIFGIEVRYKLLLWNVYIEKIHREDFMLGGLAWHPKFEDATYYFDLFVFREEAVHVTNWKKIEFNHYLVKAKETVAEKKRMSLLNECQKILLEEMPAIPLFYQKFRYLKNPNLYGYILSNINQIEFRKVNFNS